MIAGFNILCFEHGTREVLFIALYFRFTERRDLEGVFFSIFIICRNPNSNLSGHQFANNYV